MAVAPSELPQGSPSVVETIAPTPSPSEPTRQQLTTMLALSERRMLEPPLPIRIVGNSIDLDIHILRMDEHNRFSKGYEEECLREVRQSLGPNQIVFGPHLLNTAFDGVKTGVNSGHPEVEKKYVSVPDALVCEVETSESTEVPSDAAVIKVAGIIEARTGRINGNGKLAGFKNLTDAVRKRPEHFALAIESVVRGRIANHPFYLVAPPDREIFVTFFSPRKQLFESEEEGIQRHIVEHPFKKVEYKTVPLPVYQVAV